MLTKEECAALIYKHGFAAGYAVPLEPLDEEWARICLERPPHTENVCLDPRAAYPWATAVLLLVRAYAPFPAQTGLPGYYIASNAGYHAANALCEELMHMGYSAQRFEAPLVALAVKNGLGRLCKNALIDIPGYGTRTALFTVATDAAAPCVFTQALPPACGACTLCADACPAGAIDPKLGLNAPRCLRTHMESGDMPDWVAERLPGLLGCEICQAICPRNADIGVRMPTHEESDAFDLDKLTHGDIHAARTLVGKNMCTHARLQAQAAVLRARDGVDA